VTADPTITVYDLTMQGVIGDLGDSFSFIMAASDGVRDLRTCLEKSRGKGVAASVVLELHSAERDT
jgi:hypothetical protein